MAILTWFFDFGQASDQKFRSIDTSACVLHIPHKCDTQLFSGKYFHNSTGNEKQKRPTAANCLECEFTEAAAEKEIRSTTIQFYRDID